MAGGGVRILYLPRTPLHSPDIILRDPVRVQGKTTDECVPYCDQTLVGPAGSSIQGTVM